MNRWNPRQVLECASLLALWQWGRANRKRQRTGAVQDATVLSQGSWSQCAPAKPRGPTMLTVQRFLLFAVLSGIFFADLNAASAESSNEPRLVALEKLVRDDSPRVRLEALRALAKIPSAKSAELALSV